METSVDASTALVLGADLAPDDCVLQRISWWHVVVTRVWHWVWPYGLVFAALVVGSLGRSAGGGRVDSMLRLLALGIPVALIVGSIVFLRAQKQYDDRLCRIAVPEELVSMANLSPRRPIESQMLATPVVVMSDHRGLAIGEGDGLVPLRDLGVRLVIACSAGGRIGWADFEFGGATHRTACAGQLVAADGHLFDIAGR